MTLVAVAGVAALYLAPALVLWALLSARLYPGERMLERARRAGTPAPGGRPARCARRPRPARRAMPRGGVLVAWRLAGRAPPAPAAP